MTTGNKKRIVVLGGTVEAYLAAWALAVQYVKDDFEITVVDTGDAGNGNGLVLQQESLSILARFKINEKTLVDNVSLTYRLATRFENWFESGGDALQPLGPHGGPIESVAFHNFAIKKQGVGQAFEFNDYALGAAAASAGKFLHPASKPDSIFSTLGYGMHLDSDELLAFLKRGCAEQGVTVIECGLERIEPSANGGWLSGLDLGDSGRLEPDWLIDCSNHESNPVSERFPAPFESWSSLFPNDRQIGYALDSGASGEPVTTVSAFEEGLTVKAPLATSTQGRFHYSSERLGDDAAAEWLAQAEPGAVVNGAGVAFNPGIRERAWIGNYVALGHAFGRFETLDTSTFHGFLVSLERFLDLFPRTADGASESFEFNRKTRLWYENVRDLHLLRYLALPTAGPTRAELATLPASFRHKLELFESTAQIAYYEEEPFSEAYRAAAFIGVGVWPRAYHVLLDRFDFERLDQRFEDMKRMIAETVQQMPNHRDYVRNVLARM